MYTPIAGWFLKVKMEFFRERNARQIVSKVHVVAIVKALEFRGLVISK